MKKHGGILNELFLSERRQPEKAPYCMIPTIRHSGKGNYGDSKKTSVWGKGGIGRAQRISREVKIFCVIL